MVTGPSDDDWVVTTGTLDGIEVDVVDEQLTDVLTEGCIYKTDCLL